MDRIGVKEQWVNYTMASVSFCGGEPRTASQNRPSTGAAFLLRACVQRCTTGVCLRLVGGWDFVGEAMTSLLD